MPHQSPDPAWMRPGEMPVMIDWLWVYHSTIPSNRLETPRVTMSELTPILATVLPLLRPMKAPMATGTTIASQTGQPSLDMNPAQRTWESPAIEPTEKSNSPQTSGTMMARASSPITAWLPRTFLMLVDVGNVPEVFDQKLKKSIIPAKAMTRA